MPGLPKWTSQGGVRPGEVTVDDLQANQDYSPRGWEPEKIKSKLKEFNGKIPKKGASHDPRKSSDGSGTKPLFSSKIVTARTPGQGIDVIAKIKGLDELHLYVSDAGNGYACDWANWVNPTLVDASGKATKLSSLKWKYASSGWGGVNLNKNASGGTMKVAGKEVQCIGCHSNSLISYQLPVNHKFIRFLATGALDDGGARQGACGNQSSVQFHVYSKKPKVLGGVRISTGSKGSGSGSVNRVILTMRWKTWTCTRN